MEKNIKILLVIIAVLFILVGGLLINFLILKRPGPEVLNLNQVITPETPEIQEKVDASEDMDNLINNIGDLSFDEMNKILNSLESKLPFTYGVDNFLDMNQIKTYVASLIINKGNYANKNKFKNAVGNFIFSEIFSGLRTANYEDLNNYIYYDSYKKFAEQCPSIVKENLDNNNVKDNPFLATVGNIYEENFYINNVNDHYYSCNAPLNQDICNRYEGDTIWNKEVISKKDACVKQANESLVTYFNYFSKLPCENIDFDKFEGECVKDLNCNKLCELLRREIPNENIADTLNSLNLTENAKITRRAFLERDLTLCQNIKDKDQESEVRAINECIRRVNMWLAFENKDVDRIEDLVRNDREGVDRLYWGEFIINNFNELGPKLDAEIQKENPNFNFNQNELIDFCTEKINNEINLICVDPIKEIEDWFDSLR